VSGLAHAGESVEGRKRAVLERANIEMEDGIVLQAFFKAVGESQARTLPALMMATRSQSSSASAM